MESLARSLIWLCLLAFVGLQLYVLLMKRDDITWSDLAKAKLLVISQPEKYLKRNASRTIKLFLSAFVTLVIVGWVAVWWSNQR